MNGLMAKYFREREDLDLHGGPILGQSVDGFPVRGSEVPLTTQGEFEELPLVADFHCRTFRMWDDEDRQAYALIMDNVANGRFFVKEKSLVDDVEHGAPRIWLEWVQVYAQPRGPSSAYVPVPEPPVGVELPFSMRP